MILNKCKLTYFGIPGRAESIRLALAIGGIDFIDERIAFADWKPMKPSTPWGELPVLTLADGTMLAQQKAIVRFVGKECGLYPTDNLAAAKVDGVIDATEDIASKCFKTGAGMEGDEKNAARLAACREGGTVYGVLKNVDSFIGENSGSYAVGDSMTIADLIIYTSSNNLVSGLFDGVPSDALDGFSNIMALRKAVRSNPDVCKWYDGLDDDIASKLPASYGPL